MRRYENIPILEQPVTDARYRATTIYPFPQESINDFYILSVEGDRYDIYARQFYNDETLWYLIASANEAQGLSVEPGKQIRIPNSPEILQEEYINTNLNR